MNVSAFARHFLALLWLFVLPASPALAEDLLFPDPPSKSPAKQGKTTLPKPNAASQDDNARMDQLKALRARSSGDSYCQEALDVYLGAAARGSARANYNLGVFYENGECVVQDGQAARRWYLEAARLGDATARANLGLMYLQGKGVPQDTALGGQLLAKAAALREPSAEYSLGQIAQYGLYGFPKDFPAAKQHLEQAAALGYARAFLNLSFLHLEGMGVPADEAKAFSLCKQAAERGDPSAQAQLAWHYSTGRGVAQDPAQAYYWTCLALANPMADAETLDKAAANRGVIQKMLPAGIAAELEARAKRAKPTPP